LFITLIFLLRRDDFNTSRAFAAAAFRQLPPMPRLLPHAYAGRRHCRRRRYAAMPMLPATSRCRSRYIDDAAMSPPADGRLTPYAVTLAHMPSYILKYFDATGYNAAAAPPFDTLPDASAAFAGHEKRLPVSGFQPRRRVHTPEERFLRYHVISRHITARDSHCAMIASPAVAFAGFQAFAAVTRGCGSFRSFADLVDGPILLSRHQRLQDAASISRILSILH